MGLLEDCQLYFKADSLYEVLLVERTATAAECKNFVYIQIVDLLVKLFKKSISFVNYFVKN